MEPPVPGPQTQEQALSAASLEGFLLELQVREMLDDDNNSLWSGKDEEEEATPEPENDDTRSKIANKEAEQIEASVSSDAAQLGGVYEAALQQTSETAVVDDSSEPRTEDKDRSNGEEWSESRMGNSRSRAESTITASTTRGHTDRDTTFTSHDAQTQYTHDPAHRPTDTHPLVQHIAEHNPDMLLDFPNVSVDELEMELHNLTARVTVEGRIGNLVKVTTGVEVNVGDLSVSMKGVQASALLVARLDNIKQMLDKGLQAAVNNPDLLNVPMDQAGPSRAPSGGSGKSPPGTSAAGFTYKKR